MEEGNNNCFKVPVRNADLFIGTLNQFNSAYKTDFSVTSIEDLDGVKFVFVNMNNSSMDDVYLLGLKHGMFIEDKRSKGEIDF